MAPKSDFSDPFQTRRTAETAFSAPGRPADASARTPENFVKILHFLHFSGRAPDGPPAMASGGPGPPKNRFFAIFSDFSTFFPDFSRFSGSPRQLSWAGTPPEPQKTAFLSQNSTLCCVSGTPRDPPGGGSRAPPGPRARARARAGGGAGGGGPRGVSGSTGPPPEPRKPLFQGVRGPWTGRHDLRTITHRRTSLSPTLSSSVVTSVNVDRSIRVRGETAPQPPPLRVSRSRPRST